MGLRSVLIVDYRLIHSAGGVGIGRQVMLEIGPVPVRRWRRCMFHVKRGLRSSRHSDYPPMRHPGLAGTPAACGGGEAAGTHAHTQAGMKVGAHAGVRRSLTHTRAHNFRWQAT